jgi:hypothetical protein
MDKSLKRAKELMAEDDSRINEIKTRLKKLEPAKKSRKRTAGDSFDLSITNSIQRLYPKKRGRKK